MKYSAFILLLLAGQATAQTAAPPAALSETAIAATTWANTLTEEQHAKSHFKFNDEERENWHFVPRIRAGLPLGEMTAGQRALAFKMLKTTLSEEGLKQSKEVMMLESVLAETDKRPGFRDPKKYYVAIFGDPASGDPWGWRFEGHHLSLNFCSIDNAIVSLTPAFVGTNPATVQTGPHKGLRPLGKEEDLGRQLVKSLNDEQRKKAIFNTTAPQEIITAEESQARLDSKEGLAVNELSAEQKKMFDELVNLYFERFDEEKATILREQLATEKDNLLFAWAGGTELGEPHYYRVIGKELLIEYDNTQNEANHAHSVLRYFNGDFARDVLKEHYEHGHKH